MAEREYGSRLDPVPERQERDQLDTLSVLLEALESGKALAFQGECVVTLDVRIDWEHGRVEDLTRGQATMVLDADDLAALNALTDRPPSARIAELERLLRVIVEHPDMAHWADCASLRALPCDCGIARVKAVLRGES